jgi:hypothetical protein
MLSARLIRSRIKRRDRSEGSIGEAGRSYKRQRGDHSETGRLTTNRCKCGLTIPAIGAQWAQREQIVLTLAGHCEIPCRAGKLIETQASARGRTNDPIRDVVGRNRSGTL